MEIIIIFYLNNKLWMNGAVWCSIQTARSPRADFGGFHSLRSPPKSKKKKDCFVPQSRDSQRQNGSVIANAMIMSSPELEGQD